MSKKNGQRVSVPAQQRTAPDGFREKPAKSTQSQINDLREEFGILRKQFQQVMMKTAQDFKHVEDRTMTLWEYLWALIEGLKLEGKLEFLSEESIEKFRDIVLARWRADALAGIQRGLTPGQGVCTRCHHVDGGPNFFPVVEGKEVESPTCPNCKAENTLFLKDTEIVQEAVS